LAINSYEIYFVSARDVKYFVWILNLFNNQKVIMKNTFSKGIALLAIVSFVLFGCSTDNDAQSSNSSVKNDSSLFMRNSGGVYEGLEHLMTDLYADNQTVEATVSTKLMVERI